MRAFLLGLLGAFVIGGTFVGGYEIGLHKRDKPCHPDLSDLTNGKTCGLSLKARYQLKYGGAPDALERALNGP